MGAQNSTNATRTTTTEQAFHPEKSQLSEATLEQFRECTLDGSLTQVPHIGPVTEAALQAHGVSTSYQLIGRFLSLIDTHGVLAACDAFKEFLADCDTPAKHRDSVIVALGEKMVAGFRVVGLEVPEEILTSSKMKQADMETFLSKELSGDPAQDFKGVGPKSKEVLAKEGCETSWQMFGALLSTCNVAEFQQSLKTAGVASGWRTTITHQLIERLAHGLNIPTE